MLANILAVGLMASVMSFSPRYVVDNQNETITFSAEELNNNTFSYLANQVNSIPNDQDPFAGSSLFYNNMELEFDELARNEGLYWIVNDPETIKVFLNLDTTSENYAKWQISNEVGLTTFTYDVEIQNCVWILNNIEEPPTLTLSKYDLNNKKYTYLADKLNDLENAYNILGNTSITYNGTTYNFDEVANNEWCAFNNNEVYIKLDIDKTSNTYGKWTYSNFDELEDEEIYYPFTSSMTINNAQWFLDNINAPLDSGDMMTAITSGLPLMANLAQAFLNGFTSIFWNSTTSSLTTFSMFALIMLSVAIVFACIKLVLNVVRSNTGV